MLSGSHIRLVLGKASKAVERIDRKSIADTGLNQSDFMIMEALMHKGPLPINTIGKKILLTSGSMTAAVNRLENKGFLKRIQDPGDGRRFYLHLTRPGLAVIRRAYAAHRSNLEKITEVLSPEEAAEFVRLLKKIGRHADGIRLA